MQKIKKISNQSILGKTVRTEITYEDEYGNISVQKYGMSDEEIEKEKEVLKRMFGDEE